jgi:hypothetical protein
MLLSTAILSCAQGNYTDPHISRSTIKIENTDPPSGSSEETSQKHKKADVEPVLNEGSNVGDSAPDFNFLKPDGSRFTLSSLSRKNNGFLLISFTTW